MATGKVKFFKEDKAFGFILDSESGKDIFFHISGTTEKVFKDDEVEYDIQEGKKGLQAVNVKVKVAAA